MSDEQGSNWKRWLAENAARFHLYARQQTRNDEDAKDVLQEALVETWRRGGGEPQSALVFATIRRRAIDLGRARMRREKRESDLAGMPWWEGEVEDRELVERVERELKRLPDSQREVLTLKFWGGLTFAEVSEVVGIPQGTAASRYRLALESLRNVLGVVMV